MLLTANDVAEIRRMVAEGQATDLEHLPVDGILLEGVGELACSAYMWHGGGDTTAMSLVQTWAERHEVLKDAWNIVAGTEQYSLRSAPIFGAPASEVWPVPGRNDFQRNWTLFQSRYARSLERNGGFSRRLSLALSKALAEMVDNVLEHSGPSPETPAVGLAGYAVEPRRMTFIVADVGRGLLESLRTNPKWTTMESHLDALRATTVRFATRRPHSLEGEGFQQLQREMADLQGTLRFQSGDGVITMDGRNAAERQIVCGTTPYLDGFQLSVTCRIE